MMIVSVNAEEIKLHGIPTGAYREHVHSVALEWQEENRYFLIPILPRFRLFFKEPNYFGFWQTWLRNLISYSLESVHELLINQTTIDTQQLLPPLSPDRPRVCVTPGEKVNYVSALKWNFGSPSRFWERDKIQIATTKSIAEVFQKSRNWLRSA